METIQISVYIYIKGNLECSRHTMDHFPLFLAARKRENALRARTILWFVGPAKSGKSHTARQENPVHYTVHGITDTWNGYRGQPCVIVEAVEPNQVAIAQHLKTWCTEKTFSVIVDGVATMVSPSKMVLISQHRLEECLGDKDDLVFLEPRIHTRTFEACTPIISMKK